ncbi:MAG: membrane protein insertase YidC [Candidatus Aminicenantes bacterium]|nr:membrane protein insertase YidC [Candidatus Aminicenantes bacterium]
MDTKKLILAIVLSVTVLLVYQSLFMPKPAVQERAVMPAAAQEQKNEPAVEAKESVTPDIGSILNQPEATVPEKEPPLQTVSDSLSAASEIQVTVDNAFFSAVFTNRGAGLTSLILKKYKDDAGKPMDLVAHTAKDLNLYPFYFYPGQSEFAGILNNALFLYRGDEAITVGDRKGSEVVFEYADPVQNLMARKKFVFSENSYVIRLEFQVSKNGRVVEALPVVFGPDLENNDSRERTMMMNLKIAAYNGTELNSLEFAKQKTMPQAGQVIEKAAGEKGSGFYWAAYETTYFAAVFKTDPQKSKLSYLVLKQPLGDKKSKLYSYMVVSNPTAVFIGPKDEKDLAAVEKEFSDLNKIIEYGWFGSIAKIMLKGIVFIHGFIPNYGWALIVFTLLLKLILFPLTYSSSVSMAKMQSLQPKMKAIKKKYKNTKDMEQRKLMNMEIMDLYKQEKVNPAGGCLPILLQLPILWGFFRLLSVCINVRHEPWILWITDLSKKDPYYVLPILMGITQLIQQRMTPSGGDDTQKKLMYIMPFVMTIMFASFPSGLNLYWFFSNLLQIGQQKIINEKIHKEKKEEIKEIRSLKRKKGAREK